jgi:hypothetical protein
MLARFEEGQDADPTKNMSPEDAKKWREMTKKHRDQFQKKDAMSPSLGEALENLGQMAGFEDNPLLAEGCPDNLDKSECEEWEANTEKYKDKFDKGAAWDEDGVWDESAGVDAALEDLGVLAEGCPDNLDESECEEWEANTEKYKDKFDKAAFSVSPQQAWRVLSDAAKKQGVASYKGEEFYVRGPKYIEGTAKLIPGVVVKKAGSNRYHVKGRQQGLHDLVARVLNATYGAKVSFEVIPADKAASLNAALEDLGLLAEGCPDNLDESECKEWESNTDKYQDKFKKSEGGPLAEMVKLSKIKVEPQGLGKKANQVGKTILQQMGGLRRLGMMLGISRVFYHPKGVEFLWPNKQRSRGNNVKISLTPGDTYKVEFFNASVRGKKLVKAFDDVPVENLGETFERQTGWRLRLARTRLTETKKVAGEYVNLWAAVRDKKLLGATDEPAGKNPTFWRSKAGNKPVAIVPLKHVPIDLAVALSDQGTAAEAYSDAEAWRAAKKYAPSGFRRAADEKTAASPTGLYGFTKRVQSDCEVTARKLQKSASALAKAAYTKDSEVAPFLALHAKRANSLPAKMLTAALKDMGPKVAANAGKTLVTDPDKTAARKWGLYGYKSKTASLGLGSCTALRESAGRVASELHGRREGSHSKITGFLKQHAKEANCMYSRMLHAGYPDADRRCASESPAEVADWLAWEN